MQKKPSLLIRILILILIAAAIAGLWLFKNADTLGIVHSERIKPVNAPDCGQNCGQCMDEKKKKP